MKQLLLALLLVSFASSAALADSPEAILKDYRKQAAQAVASINQSLEKAVAPFIDTLTKQKDEAGIEELTNQYKDKMAGEPVATPRAEIVQIFTAYDEARDTALAPIKKSSLARIEGQMKMAGGAKPEAQAELAKVREEVEAGKIIKELSFPEKWLCRAGPMILGELIFLPDGRWTYVTKGKDIGPMALASTSGEWVKTSAHDLTLKQKGAVLWKVSIAKNSGILRISDRQVRFLSLPPKT